VFIKGDLILTSNDGTNFESQNHKTFRKQTT